MRSDPRQGFPWLTVFLLLVFLVLAWMNFSPALESWLSTRRLKSPAESTSVSSPALPAAPATAPVLATPPPGEEFPLRAGELNNIAIYDAVSPSVVSVANRTLVRGGFFGMQVFEVPQGSGSGFVWDRKGHIISNYHVVHQASAITVTFADGTSFDAKIVGTAPDYDIAVLKIDAPADMLVPVHVGSSRELKVGQTVLAIGNPFGLDTTLTVGVVSALGRNITSMTDRRIQDVIQTDAAINPGNSGGPLLNTRGQLIGINTAILSPSGAYAGIGFAVPCDTVARVVPQLIENGKVSRTGIGVQLLPDHVTQRAGLEGAAILSVVEGSEAAKAGLTGVRRVYGGMEFGDVVIGVDKTLVASVEDLCAVFDRHQPGETVVLTCRRGNRTREVLVRLQVVN